MKTIYVSLGRNIWGYSDTPISHWKYDITEFHIRYASNKIFALSEAKKGLIPSKLGFWWAKTW